MLTGTIYLKIWLILIRQSFLSYINPFVFFFNVDLTEKLQTKGTFKKQQNVLNVLIP